MDKRDIRDRVEKFIISMVSVVHIRAFYGKDHKLTRDAVDKLHSMLSSILTGSGELTIGIIGNEVAFDKEPFYETSKKAGKFIAQLKKIKVEKFSFLKGVEKTELSIFIDVLAAEIRSHEKHEGINKALSALGVKNILAGAMGEEDAGGTVASGEDTGAGGETVDISGSSAVFQSGIEVLKQVLNDMGDGKPIDVRAVRLVITKVMNSLLKNKSSLLMLAALKKHDEYTFIHSMNVAIFTLIQAEALGIPEEFLSDMGIAALMHDVGKLQVEASVIKKYGNLNRQEVEKVRLHPIDGAEILLESPGVPLVAAIAAFEHHLKYDTQGYPARLYGDTLNLASMIISIADAYDAMRGGHANYQELRPEKIYETMTDMSGENFHPDLIELFFKKIGIYPPGTLVELDDKSVGLVIKESASDPERPRVKILYDSKGAEVEAAHIADLSEKDGSSGRYKRSIARSVVASEKHRIPDEYRGL